MLKTCPVCGTNIKLRRSLCPEHLKEYGSKSRDWPYWLYQLVKDQNKHLKREERHQDLPFTDEAIYLPSDDDKSNFDGKDEHSAKFWASINATILDDYDQGNRLKLRGERLHETDYTWELPPSFRNAGGILIVIYPKRKKRKTYGQVKWRQFESPSQTISMLQEIQSVKNLVSPLQYKILIMVSWKIPQEEIGRILNIDRNKVVRLIEDAKNRTKILTSVTTN